jgi:eukaryotic-like serine/threonine-protein kinase
MNTSPPVIELHAGSSLGRYELLLPIAKGGMAMVWAARLRGTRGFQKLVAVKTILAGAVDSVRMEEMFLEEAQLASQIHHPNVVATHDLGEHEGVLYLVMEWVEGEPLNAVLAKAGSGVPLDVAVNLIGQACKGLHAAHELRDDHGALLGVVHRDVSPQNILVTYGGTAKLVDFGIAKATSKASGLTEAGEVKGKFAYMAPEQVRGGKLDARTDLFALGILLYAITTGKHPFRGENPAQTVQNICAERPPTPPSALVSDYPAALEQVVMKSISKDPDARFATATEMLAALEDAMPGPLEASFDARVAEYMKSLFGSRPSERRAALRMAQEHLDRQRGESSSSISVATLRAISIDQTGLTPSSSTPRLVLEPMGTTQASASESKLLAPPPKKRGGLYAAAAVAAVALGAAVPLMLRAAARSEDRTVAATSPVPSTGLELAGTPPDRQAAAAPSAAPSTEPAEEQAPTLDAKKPKKGARGHDARAPRVAAAPVALPATSAPEAATKASATAATPATAGTPPAPTPTASTNSWDRNAFGGRH